MAVCRGARPQSLELVERYTGVSETTRLLWGGRDWGGKQKWEQVSCFSPDGSRKRVVGLEAEAAAWRS